MKILKNGLFITAWLLLLFFVVLMYNIVYPYTSGATDIDFLATKQAYIALKHYLSAFYIHIFLSLFLLAAGLLQFSSRLIRHFPAFHRWIGRVYMFLVLCFSAPAALYMSFYANGGWTAKASFILLSILWWWTAFYAYQAILRKNTTAHRHWMLRHYALTLSAVTLRLVQFGFAAFTLYDLETTYAYIAAPSWLFNLLCAEFWIKWRPKV